MDVLSSIPRAVWLWIALIFILGGCQSNTQTLKSPAREVIRADFSGSWEMDYSLNDSIEAKVDAYFYRLRRQLERQSNGRQYESRSEIPINHGVANTVIAMARFVERISRTQVMDITQTYSDVVIERENTFTLNCEFADSGLQIRNNPFGAEVCGWDGHQLIFHLKLPEGLAVQHRMTLSSDRSQLNVATTMISDRAPEPFTLNRSYTKFDRSDRGYQCEQTVEKGKVCRVLTGQPNNRPADPNAPSSILSNVK
ncbi:MAG: hypothetical protein ACRBBW_03410 [Cellvibrionaceae bacterium]